MGGPTWHPPIHAQTDIKNDDAELYVRAQQYTFLIVRKPQANKYLYSIITSLFCHSPPFVFHSIKY